MKIGLYKTQTGGIRRSIHIYATQTEYAAFGLGHPGGWNVRKESDTLIVERTESHGKHFARETNGTGWRLTTRLDSEHLIPVTFVHREDMGKPGEAILMMVNLAPLANRPMRTTSPRTSPVRHIEPKLLPTHSFPNAKIMRKVHELLGDYFLEKQHRYLGGWSDEKVAAEAHCSLEFVKRQREEAYGPISVVQTDLDRIISRLKEVVQELEQHSIKQGARQ